jgi:hypothetical protein
MAVDRLSAWMTKISGGPLLGFFSREQDSESLCFPYALQATKALPLPTPGLLVCMKSQLDALMRRSILRQLGPQFNA